MPVGVFILMFLLILLSIVGLIGIFILFRISYKQFRKGDKINGYVFLTLGIIIVSLPFLLFGAMFYSFEKQKNAPKPLMKNSEIVQHLKNENIILNDSFKIVSSKIENDLVFYKTDFKLILSDKDFATLKKDKFKGDSVISVTQNPAMMIHDTLQMKLTKHNILQFYKSHYDANN